MPTPKKKENKKTFIKRCISFLYEKEPEILTSKDKKNKQSYAICNSIYDREKNENNIYTFNESIKYMDKNNSEKLEKIVIPFMNNRILKINNINIYFYIDNNFDYYEIWDNLLSLENYKNNIFGLVDKHFSDNFTTPEIRNSLFNIIVKFYKDKKIKNLLDNRLIKIIGNNPVKYGYLLNAWKHKINNNVHNELKWIKNIKKYNM